MPDFVESQPLFDIPVYRCSEGEYGKEFSEIERRYMGRFDERGAPISYSKIHQQFMETHWYPWKFNEIIGYIHLHVEHSPTVRIKIDGDLFYVNVKRIGRGFKGKMFGIGKIFEHFVYEKNTSRQIYEGLVTGLEKLSHHRPLEKRYLYLEDFRRIGSLVDWRKLIGLE